MAYLGTAKQKSLGQVKLWLVEDTPNNSRDLYVLSDKTDQTQARTLIEQSIIGEQPEADNNKLLDMLGLTERSKSFIKAETAVFDRWFQAPWFIKEVLEPRLQTGRQQGQSRPFLLPHSRWGRPKLEKMAGDYLARAIPTTHRIGTSGQFGST